MFRYNNTHCFLRRKNIFLIKGESISPCQTELGFEKKFNDVKNKIDSIDYNTWNKVRRFSNNYEFPLTHKNRHNLKPISRAFFKLWEILHDFSFELGDTSLHIAEAPGGFIQSFDFFCSKNNIDITKIYTTSLLNRTNKNIPTYSNILNNEKIHINYGADGTGDIYNTLNITFLKNHIDSKIKFITADGGFNEDGNFNIKEQLHYKLFLSEIIIALQNQTYGGSFVIKFFDLYTYMSVDLLYILSEFYDSIHITKPLTSRPTNSEKYIICKGFKKLTTHSKLLIIKLLDTLQFVNENTYRILNIDIPLDFIDFIKKSNQHFMQFQIVSIEKNLSLIQQNTKKINRNNERKQWLLKYDLL